MQSEDTITCLGLNNAIASSRRVALMVGFSVTTTIASGHT